MIMKRSLIILIALGGLVFAGGLALLLAARVAAVVNGTVIMARDVNRYADAVQHLAAWQSSASADLPTQRQGILRKLVEDEIVADLLAKRGLRVTESEFNRYYRYLLTRLKIVPEDAQTKIQKQLGLTEKQFQKLVIWPDLKRTKLHLAWLKDSTDSEAYRKAQAVREPLVSTSTPDFISAARDSSDDGQSKYIGGEIGFLSSDELEPWLADPVFNLEIGQISEILVSTRGYHIFQVAGKDDTSDPGRLQLRHILIKAADFQGYLDEQKKNYKIWIMRD